MLLFFNLTLYANNLFTQEEQNWIAKNPIVKVGADGFKNAKYGFDGYLRKPVILDDLLEELSKYLTHGLEENDNKSSEDFIINDKEKLKEAIIQLEGELKKEWEDIKDGGDFTVIENFAKKIQELSKVCDIKILENYVSELINNIEAFDIERVEYMMNSYLNIIETLGNKID